VNTERQHAIATIKMNAPIKLARILRKDLRGLIPPSARLGVVNLRSKIGIDLMRYQSWDSSVLAARPAAAVRWRKSASTSSSASR
jgi:hypothetical protein